MEEHCDLVHRLRFIQEKYDDFLSVALVIGYFNDCEQTDYELACMAEKLNIVSEYVKNDSITLQSICECLSHCERSERSRILASSAENIISYLKSNL